MPNYEIYEPNHIPRPAEDDEMWVYKIKNLETGNEFIYRIAIKRTTLNSQGLRHDIQNAVNTRGRSLVDKHLSLGNEYKMEIEVGNEGIISKALIGNTWVILNY
jgi:hypothetical protein